MSLDTGMSAIFAILSWLTMVFSFGRPEEKVFQVLLSLAGVFMIIYQVSYLIPFRKALLTFSKNAYQSLYHDKYPRWRWWSRLICAIVPAVISIVIAFIIGYTKASNVALLVTFLIAYLIIFMRYALLFRKDHKSVIHHIICWNIGYCFVASAGAFTSLVLYLKGRVDFITSLWVSGEIK